MKKLKVKEMTATDIFFGIQECSISKTAFHKWLLKRTVAVRQRALEAGERKGYINGWNQGRSCPISDNC